MADEILDRPDVVRQILRERERLAYQPRDPLPQRTVKPLDAARQPRPLAAGYVPLGRDDALVRLPVGAVEGRPPPIKVRDSLPQLARRLAAAVADVEGDDLASLFVESQPEPNQNRPLRVQSLRTTNFSFKSFL